MIRPLTMISAALFVLSGAYMFVVKHRAQVLDDKLAQVAQATRLDQQRIRVLQAQWALEVDPSRLQQLSSQFTTLQPMKPSQMTVLPELATALPPPNSPVPGENPESPALAVPAGNGASGPVAQAVPSTAVAAGTAPVHLASATMTVPASEVPRAHTHTMMRLASTRMPEGANARMTNVEALLHNLPGHDTARRLPRARHETESHLYAEARPAGLAPLSQAPMGAQVMSVRAVAASTPPLPPSMAYSGGSMLGMAQATGGGN